LPVATASARPTSQRRSNTSAAAACESPTREPPPLALRGMTRFLQPVPQHRLHEVWYYSRLSNVARAQCNARSRLPSTLGAAHPPGLRGRSSALSGLRRYHAGPRLHPRSGRRLQDPTVFSDLEFGLPLD
jgi:hypothetical protein